MASLEVAQDRERIRDHGAPVHEHRHEILAAHLAHGGAVGRVDNHGLGVEPLEGKRERDALNVGRERYAKQAHAAIIAGCFSRST